MARIETLNSMEILDSRGRPTVQTTCRLSSGAVATASVPSGASTGTAEALELRDGDPKRYHGLGCRRAAENVRTVLAEALRRREFAGQVDLDRAMRELDGTPDKSRLGANAILSVSLAFARACAAERSIPLYQHFAELLGRRLETLPRLTVNLFSGGKHAGGQVQIQDVLIVPIAANNIDESLAQTYAVYQSAARLCLEKYNTRGLTADEGGLAPPFPDVETMLADAVESIRRAGLKPGEEIALAIDVASSHFYQNGRYMLSGASPTASGRGQDTVAAENGLRSIEMTDQIHVWIDRYPIVSVEDGLAEDDWTHWPKLRETIGDCALVLGDDLLCTNPRRIQRAIDTRAASALLLKVNQIGTLSEAAESYKLARAAGWAITVSARSGETEDNWLADLAVGWGGDQIKVGSITQSERLAKYNRLLAIEAETRLPVAPWPGR